MISVKYILALWKRKTLGQIIGFAYMVPLLLFVLCLLMTLLLPLTSDMIFYGNASYEYCYKMPCNIFSVYDRKTVPNETAYSLLHDKDRNALLYSDSAVVYTVNDKAMPDTSELRLYVARKDADLSGTIFTEENFTGKGTPYSNKYDGTSQLYVTHNTLKHLNADVGDTVITEYDSFAHISEDHAIRSVIAGTLKPEYDGSNNRSLAEYDKYSDFSALLTVDEELFFEIAGNDLSEIMTVVFSDEKSDFTDGEAQNITEEIRTDKMETLENTLRERRFVTKVVLRFAFSILVMAAALEMEYGFTRRRCEHDMTVFSMLGMRRSSVRRTIAVQVLIRFLISVAAAVLLCRYVYFRFISDMYCEPLLLLFIAASFVIAGTAYTVIRSLIKSLKGV